MAVVTRVRIEAEGESLEAVREVIDDFNWVVEVNLLAESRQPTDTPVVTDEVYDRVFDSEKKAWFRGRRVIRYAKEKHAR